MLVSGSFARNATVLIPCYATSAYRPCLLLLIRPNIQDTDFLVFP